MAQQLDGLGGLGVGGGVLIAAGQAQVGDDQRVGDAVVGDHVIGLDLRHIDDLLVFQDGVSLGPAGELVEVGGAGAVHHDHGVLTGGGGGGSGVDGRHLAPQGEQGDPAAGSEGAVPLGVGLGFLRVGSVDGGVPGDGVPLAARGADIAGLRIAHERDGDRTAVIGDKGDDLALVVEDK